MKRLNLVIQAAKQSIAAVETPEKKREQLEQAKLVAHEFLTGIWLDLAIFILDQLEKTIKG